MCVCVCLCISVCVCLSVSGRAFAFVHGGRSLPVCVGLCEVLLEGGPNRPPDGRDDEKHPADSRLRCSRMAWWAEERYTSTSCWNTSSKKRRSFSLSCWPAVSTSAPRWPGSPSAAGTGTGGKEDREVLLAQLLFALVVTRGRHLAKCVCRGKGRIKCIC